MKVAFVAPFFGAGAAGGAEAECRQTAIRLAAQGVEVDVFTTCILDLTHDWNVNYHRQGESREDGMTVRRFRVEYADLAPFFRLNERVLKGEILSEAEEKQFIAMHIYSIGLCRSLAAAWRDYDWVVLIPYLFGTTCFASMLCAPKAVLIPCLHDEPYARMRVYAGLFDRVAKIVFHTRAELELAQRLYGIPAGKGLLLGEGIETEFESSAERFRKRHGIERPFVLYAGRKSETKNVHTLIRDFALYRQRHAGDLALVLIGPGHLPVPRGMEEHILDLGFVTDQDKKDAYSAAAVFCQPSLNESFSIVIMESWICGRPCLVHGGCAVTREHVVRAGGGLYYENAAEFGKCLEFLLANGDMARRMGSAGRTYVRSNFAWDRIIQRYREEVFV